MKRRIIEIDKTKCNGCGICVKACHEGAIALVQGKAQLMREDYCDGLGDCLPNCPMEAISFIEKEAPAYDAEAVKRNMQSKDVPGCPGSMSKKLVQAENEAFSGKAPSRLAQWPVQIKLMPIQAPYYEAADLLIAADCTAFSYGSFHNDFMKDRITVIGCPKLDAVDYSEKLARICATNDIRSITVARMEVPCCGGLENAVKTAVALSGKDIDIKVVTFTSEGKIL